MKSFFDAVDKIKPIYDVAYKEDWITNPKNGIRRFFEIYRQLNK